MCAVRVGNNQTSKNAFNLSTSRAVHDGHLKVQNNAIIKKIWQGTGANTFPRIGEEMFECILLMKEPEQ